jgi:DNA helicase-2/ATP-dependent DNA helicase PcrA
MDYHAFVSGRKTMLIAPAGYGKTHTIAECLKYTIGKQLILTHTHAGVASIKEKIKKSDIGQKKYSIETISSFAQKYSHAFCTGKNIPDQEAKEYHAFVVRKAMEILASPTVKRVLAASYAGLFVDEYQDCAKDQHAMISALSVVLPTHILGDPMQGIFDFNGDAVDFQTDLDEYIKFPELSIPHRWYRDENSKGLGDMLKVYRDLLKLRQPISLTSSPDNGLYVMSVNPGDLFNPESPYAKGLKKLIQNPDNQPEYESLLVIVPEYVEVKDNDVRVPKGDIKHRAQIRAQIDYSKSLRLLEAIDDGSFYAIAKKADGLIDGIGRARKKTIRIRKDACDAIFNKTDLDVWFNNTGLKNKRSESDKKRSVKMQIKIEAFINTPSANNLHDVILEAKNGLKLKYKRDEIVFSFLQSLKEAEQSSISVYEAMKKRRNTIRRSGRKIHGKCIGTTLLTKGLEFDTVAILDAHRFECPKHLYVALTRCCKKLIIFTEQTTLLEKGS